MKDIVRNIASLIKVKSIVTFLIVGVFAALAIRGTIDPASVKDISMIVVSFYFGVQHEKRD